MNDEITTHHLKQITDPAAQALYESLCKQYAKAFETVTDSAEALIYDIALADQIKRRLLQDIEKRGAVEIFRNGRQSVMRENKSVVQTQRLMEQQRRNLAELGLTPGAKRKKEPAGDGDPEDDGDDFDKFE